MYSLGLQHSVYYQLTGTKAYCQSCTMLRGRLFMTSTRRGRGQAQVDACGRGSQLRVDVHTKIRAQWRHPVFFSCKEVDISRGGLRIFRWEGMMKCLPIGISQWLDVLRNWIWNGRPTTWCHERSQKNLWGLGFRGLSTYFWSYLPTVYICNRKIHLEGIWTRKTP